MVLDSALEFEGHFGADQLFDKMKYNNLNISRATVYNTLELLTDCGLVVKRNFGDNRTSYEKNIGQINHDHLVCRECNKIIEIENPGMKEFINKLIKNMDFEFESYSLNIYGKCINKQQCKKKS